MIIAAVPVRIEPLDADEYLRTYGAAYGRKVQCGSNLRRTGLETQH